MRYVPDEAYPVVPGLPRFRVRAAANPKRLWDWSFAKSLNHPAACRWLSFGAAAGAGWSARLCWASVRTTPMPYRLLKLAEVYA